MPDVLYETHGPIARVTLNRPRYRNAQSYALLDALDEALDRAANDHDVKVVVVAGAGDHFSSGHDLGTPESLEDRARRNIPEDALGDYESFRKYNNDLTLKWRNHPKPTIAMVRGYCIYGGWMIAAAMDVVFASEDALFLPGFVEWFSIPWDIGARKTKELLFESRFLTAAEAHELGFVGRVFSAVELEAQTMAYANRVAENSHTILRMSKLAVNNMLDQQGFSASTEAAFHDYLVMARSRGVNRVEGERRLGGVDLALRGLRGQRPGLTGPDPAPAP
jgi:enoyl-CoA hydratase